ncbi:hypothetical protein BLNAU_5200 [Blattamonas nauphoetae]|uniref:Uncharacterized protein n=1 Tax=Blattamonas nauphoetae TaxID=2049346 RepID=A0ABQ9Y7G5_9EUKA|nr:hypothetical protein BLNAU_5200 [Blattamonas nauphoetae]
MFFLFGFLSATSFSTPNAHGDVPIAVDVQEVIYFTAGAVVKITYSEPGCVLENDYLRLTFTPADSSGPSKQYGNSVTKSEISGNTLVFRIGGFDQEDGLDWDVPYIISSYNHSKTKVDVQTNFPITFALPPLTMSYVVPTKDTYYLTFTLDEPSLYGYSFDITFSSKQNNVTVEGNVSPYSDSYTITLSIVDKVENSHDLEIGTTYTITAEGFHVSPSTITPADNYVLIGSSKLTPAEEGKKPDGAKDKVTLTLVNELFTASLPEDASKHLMLHEGKRTEVVADHTLDESDKFKWTPAAGSLAVEYVFNDCPIKAGSTVRATLEMTGEIKFENQDIEYAEGVKSVASVAAALLAVLAFVF